MQVRSSLLGYQMAGYWSGWNNNGALKQDRPSKPTGNEPPLAPVLMPQPPVQPASAPPYIAPAPPSPVPPSQEPNIIVPLAPSIRTPPPPVNGTPAVVPPTSQSSQENGPNLEPQE